jgi:hypothetical protein
MSEGNGREEIDKERSIKSYDWWLVIGGIGLDWYYAFTWFSGRYSWFSLPVFRQAGYALALCALLAIIVGRRRWRISFQVFFLASYSFWMFTQIALRRH